MASGIYQQTSEPVSVLINKFLPEYFVFAIKREAVTFSRGHYSKRKYLVLI